MVQIRCPACDTPHALEAALFARGPRKVRCASCRMVWEAGLPEADVSDAGHLTRPVSGAAQPVTNASEPGAGEDDLAHGQSRAFEEGLDDLTDTGLTAQAAIPVEPMDSHPAPAMETEPETPVVQEPRERLRRRSGKAARKPAQPARRPRLVLVAAAGFATFASLLLFRHDIVRTLPDTAPIFGKMGLDINLYGLDISDVSGKILRDESSETLEIAGKLVNITRKLQKIPPLRLSIRNRGGQELYVWTAAAEQAELAPGESLNFRRRLASPPSESHSVMVRFVARDDIVASIR